jgi:hypothetical protein
MEKTDPNSPEKDFRICESCQKRNPANSSFCMACGLRIESELEIQSNIVKVNRCPVCNKSFPEDVKFCLFDGNPVTKIDEVKLLQQEDASEVLIKKKPDLEGKKNILYQFSGFEISTNGMYSSLPLELLKSSTSILNPSPKIPKEVKLVNTSDFFSILAPKPKLTFLGFFTNAGLTRKNITSYSITYFFVVLLFLLWMVAKTNIVTFLNSPSILVVILIWSLIISLIFLLPVIFTGRLVARLQSEMVFKIEPSFLILSFAINIIVLQINFPFPIVVFPGEMKIKTLPSKIELGKAIHKGLVGGFLLLILSTIVVIIGLSSTILSFGTDIVPSINLGFLMASLALSINLLPFGNMFGRLARFRPISYWSMTMITFMILMFAVSLVNVVE